VVAVREKPLMAFARVTVALAMTAPEGSVTVPEMVPAFPADCAKRLVAASARARLRDATEMPRRLDVCMGSPFRVPVAF
jgi:hypothetical protein